MTCMNRRLKRGFAGASAVGAALFVGLFAWLYAIGFFPLELFLVLSAINIAAAVASLKLALKTE